MAPVLQPETFSGVLEDVVEVVLDEMELVVIEVEVDVEEVEDVAEVEEDVELEVALELELDELPPVPETVTSRLLRAMLAQSGVLGTFVSPAYPPPYSTPFPGFGKAISTPSVVVHCPVLATNISGAVKEEAVPITFRYAQF